MEAVLFINNNAHQYFVVTKGMFSIVWIQTDIQASTLSISTEDKAVIPYYKPTNVGKRLLVTSSLELMFSY